MSSYTMQLRTLIEQPTQYETGLSAKEKIEIGRQQLFDFDYPIFDEAYKKVFETNFIRKFYMREIGFETEGLFKFQLETWLLINMPYFNKLYESELIEFDPLVNSSVDVTHNKIGNKIQNDVVDGTRNSTGNETANKVENQTSNTSSQDDSTGKEIGNKIDNQITNATGTADSTGSEVSNVVENQTSSTTGQSDSTGSSDTVSSETSNETGTGTKTDDNFERNLKTNNPDTRLAITTNDGEGVIEYASSIEEETENNSQSATNQTDGTKNGTVGTDTVDSTTSSSSLTADSTGDSTVTKTDSASTTSNTVADSVSDSVIDTTNTKTSTADSVVDTTGDTTLDKTSQTLKKDTLESSINDVEDFIQHRAGKIGIQTYSKMVMEYRSSFLRIDKEIFDEMQELFMLVY